MKKLLLLAGAALALVFAGEGAVQKKSDRTVYVHNPNYDVKKIAPYTLEDPLAFKDGRKVTKETWPARRQEILDIFAHEMYGVEPPPPEAVVTEKFDDKVSGAGFAIRRQYHMWFKKDKTGPRIDWALWLPRAAKRPVPVILLLNYAGNHEFVPDPEIPVTTAWLGISPGQKADPATRGKLEKSTGDNLFPLGTILARGYAVMTACYGEVSPDDQKNVAHAYSEGVFTLWGKYDPARQDTTTALGAWGWALSRGLDLACTIPEIDAKKAVVTGYSRLAKAALIAAARDTRFAVCAPVQTGGGGCPLAKRDYGENTSTENRNFPHWFCPAYAKYAKDPHRTLTFDQHLFLASLAPRALLVLGYDNAWFDTEGEFLAMQAASPAWELFGEGLPKVAWPADYETTAIGKRAGYVRRGEGHGISAYDWKWIMDFSDQVFGR